MSLDLQVGGMAVSYVMTLISMWSAVIILGRARRGLSWISMLGGITLFSLGTCLLFLGIMTLVGFGIVAFGMMLFGFGFCFHSLGVARAVEKVRELETINTSLVEELDRARQGEH